MKGQHSRLFSDDDLDAIVRAYKQGESVLSIATRYAVSTAPVRNALRIRDVATRPQGTRGYRPRNKRRSAP